MKPATASLDVSPEAPWLGLRSFTESATGYFFGRATELTDLHERVVHKPLTVLFGQSGWGKTSLLRAGLVPRLRAQGYLPVGVRLVHDNDAPPLEQQMLVQLANALKDAQFQKQSSIITETIQQGGAPSLWLLFHDPQFGLVGPEAGSIPCPVFIIDQFEEIFTHGDRGDRRAASTEFRDALAALVENRPPASLRTLIEADDDLADRIVYQAQNCRVLLSLRYDFLHLLERWRRQMPSVMDNRMELRLLGGRQAFDAVVRPGQMREGLPPIIPDDVGSAIVRFVSGSGPEIELKDIDAVPPLLSLVCAELNAQRIAAGQQQISQAQFEGSSAEILESFYTRSFEAATYGEELAGAPEFTKALRSLRALVEERLLSADGFRESVALDTIQRELRALVPANVAKQALNCLVERRLLTVEERGGVQRMELTHDVLTRIAKTSRDQRQETEALERAKRERERAEREADAIRRQRNRLRGWTAAAAVSAFIAVIGATLGWRGMIHAREAAAEAKAQQAEALSGYQAARDATDQLLARIADQDMAYVPGIQPVREELAGRAVAQYTALLAKRPNDQALRLGLLKAQASQASILTQIGTLEEAVKANEALMIALAEARKQAPSVDLDLLVAESALAYDLFIYQSDLPAQSALLDQVLKLCEPLVTGEHEARARLFVGSAYNRKGNWSHTSEQKVPFFEKSRATLLPLEATTRDPETLRCLSAAIFNLGYQHSRSLKEDQRKEGGELLAEAEEILQRALDLKPDSPALIVDQTIGLNWKATALAKSGDFKAAQAIREQEITRSRMAVAANPRVTRYRANLANSLKGYAAYLTSIGDDAKARACYDEAIGLLKDLVERREMRPRYGGWLLDIADSLSSFEHFGRGLTVGSKGDPKRAFETREKFIKLGRSLVAKYPDAVDLSSSLGGLLGRHASRLEGDEKPAEIMKLYAEATILMQRQFDRLPEQCSPYEANNFIDWCNQWHSTVQAAPGDHVEECARILDSAIQKQPWCLNHDSKDNLLNAASKRAKLFLTQHQPDQAAELCLRMIEFTKPAYEEKPYYWFLRNHYGDTHLNLARAWQALGEKEKELHAWQDWVRIIVGPVYGNKHEELLKPELQATDENLAIFRKLENDLPGLTSFSIMANFGGMGVPVNVWVPNSIPDADFDPYVDQARYYQEERDGIFSEVARKEIRRLSTIAHDRRIALGQLVLNSVRTNPLWTAESALEATQKTLDRRIKESEASAKAVTEANAALVQAFLQAAEKAVANGDGPKLIQYAESALARGASGAGIDSKRGLILWLKDENKEALAGWLNAWTNEPARNAVTDDFSRLAESTSGLDILSEIRRQAIPVSKDIAEAAGSAWKSGHEKRLNDALTELKKAEEAYTKQNKFPQRRALAKALCDAASAAMYAGRWADVNAWLQRTRDLGFEFGDQLRRGIALVFLDKEAEAIVLLRPIWAIRSSGKTIADVTAEEMLALERAGFTHPGLARVRSALDKELPQLTFDKYKSELDEAEKAYAANTNDTTRRALVGELVGVADSAMFLRRFSEVEAWARRSIELDPAEATANFGNLANALLFQGKFDEAMTIYRAHWLDALGGGVLGDSTFEDYARLAARGITHPDTEKVKAVMAVALPTMLKERSAHEFKEAEARIKEAEAAIKAESSDGNRWNLYLALMHGSRCALFIRDWTSAAQYAERGQNVTGRDALWSFGKARQGMALIFTGEYDKAVPLIRPYWTTKYGSITTIGSILLDDFDKLEKVGITHPDVARLKRELGPVTKSQTASP